MNIGLANGLNMGYKVIAKNNKDDRSVIIITLKPITLTEIKLVEMSREGAAVYLPPIEKNFERIKYK